MKEDEEMFGECHAHLVMDGENYKHAVSIHEKGVQEDAVRRWLEVYQKREIPFIRDGGDALGVSKKAKEIAQEYGIDYRTPVFAIHKKGHYGKIVGREFSDLKEYALLVREVKRQKGDFIKIMLTGIVDFHRVGVLTSSPLRRDEIHEMIHIAHEEGFSVMGHVNGNETVTIAAEEGIDSIEHGNYIEEEAIEAMGEHHTVWVPTVVTVKNLIGTGRYDDEIIKEIYAIQSERIKKAWDKNVILALGSDAGAYAVPHGQGIYDEWNAFCEIIGQEKEAMTQRLKAGEEEIRRRFARDAAH